MASIAPFAAANSGFKDELVMLSTTELATRRRFRLIVLVSADEHFDDPQIGKRIENTGAAFSLVQKISTANSLLEQAFSATVQAEIQKERDRAKELSEQQRPLIRELATGKVRREGIPSGFLDLDLHNKLGVPFEDLPLIRRIVDLEPQGITDVLIAMTDKCTGRRLATIVVVCRLTVEVESRSCPPFGPPISFQGALQRHEVTPSRVVQYEIPTQVHLEATPIGSGT